MLKANDDVSGVPAGFKIISGQAISIDSAQPGASSAIAEGNTASTVPGSQVKVCSASAARTSGGIGGVHAVREATRVAARTIEPIARLNIYDSNL